MGKGAGVGGEVEHSGTESKGRVAGEGAGEGKDGQDPARPPKEASFIPRGIKSHRKGLFALVSFCSIGIVVT